MSYVLAEYNGQTRKLPGQWNKKKYGQLMKEVVAKFSIDRQTLVDIKVYDKSCNQYFIIDRSEMREIPSRGQIRVVKRKGGKAAGKQASGGKQSPSGGKRKGSPLKPPGVPPYSREDDMKRNQWKINSRVEIYSEGQEKWQKGVVVDIFRDNEGEWLVIKYGGMRTKEIQRFSNYIRPPQKKQQPQAGKKQKQGKGSPKSPVSKKKGGDGKAKQAEKKEKKPKAPPKVTTQSKYVRKERPPPPTLADNQILIKGNSSHIKKYIDTACMLLRGTNATNKAKPSADEDVKGAEEEAEAKKYDVIELFGSGRAMGFVVSTAEIVKRIVGGLYQQTILESIEQTDVWTPTEEGLRDVEVTRSVAQLKIVLAFNEKDVDKSAIGYQEPISNEDFAANLEYNYTGGDNATKGRRGSRRTRGKGRGRGGQRGSPKMKAAAK